MTEENGGSSSMTVISQPWADRLRFLHSFIRAPHLVGSVVPSSRHLTDAMMRKVPFTSAERIVELGAGTGVFTQALAQGVRPEAQVLLFEQDQRLRALLSERYPRFYVEPDALGLLHVLDRVKWGKNSVDVILSGLPFACFPKGRREELLAQVASALKPGGLFVAFQYSWQMKRSLANQFSEMSIEFVPRNFPPAFVYTCRN